MSTMVLGKNEVTRGKEKGVSQPLFELTAVSES
jgi:hypothetical protein